MRCYKTIKQTLYIRSKNEGLQITPNEYTPLEDVIYDARHDCLTLGSYGTFDPEENFLIEESLNEEFFTTHYEDEN